MPCKDGRRDLKGLGEGGGGWSLKNYSCQRGGGAIFMCNYIFGGEGKGLIHHTFLTPRPSPPHRPPRRSENQLAEPFTVFK